MALLSVLFIMYFILLLSFCFISHPVFYCGLLVTNSLICSFICYCSYGFSWYSLILCLVYIGGVYILFIFVSVFSPNTNLVNFLDVWNISFYSIIFLLVTIGVVYTCLNLSLEFSSNLCNSVEGVFYICLCLTLVFGFIILSLIMSVNFNFYR